MPAPAAERTRTPSVAAGGHLHRGHLLVPLRHRPPAPDDAVGQQGAHVHRHDRLLEKDRRAGGHWRVLQGARPSVSPCRFPCFAPHRCTAMTPLLPHRALCTDMQTRWGTASTVPDLQQCGCGCHSVHTRNITSTAYLVHDMLLRHVREAGGDAAAGACRGRAATSSAALAARSCSSCTTRLRRCSRSCKRRRGGGEPGAAPVAARAQCEVEASGGLAAGVCSQGVCNCRPCLVVEAGRAGRVRSMCVRERHSRSKLTAAVRLRVRSADLGADRPLLQQIAIVGCPGGWDGMAHSAQSRF